MGALQPGRRLLAGVAHAALDLVYSPSCLSCRGATATHGALCPGCWGRINFIEKPFCDRLGTPFAYDLGIPGLLSPEAMAHPPAYARARAVARFEDGPVRQLVHRLKYQDRMELAEPLGAWMARAGDDILAEANCLIPVPLHRRRLMWRQFNQAQALAVAVGAACGKPVAPFLLHRVKRTAPQIGLTRAQRASNVQGAFAVPDEAETLRRRAEHRSRRRCSHDRGDDQCRLPRPAQGWGRPRRCARLCSGCERRLKRHI